MRFAAEPHSGTANQAQPINPLMLLFGPVDGELGDRGVQVYTALTKQPDRDHDHRVLRRSQPTPTPPRPYTTRTGRFLTVVARPTNTIFPTCSRGPRRSKTDPGRQAWRFTPLQRIPNPGRSPGPNPHLQPSTARFITGANASTSHTRQVRAYARSERRDQLEVEPVGERPKTTARELRSVPQLGAICAHSTTSGDIFGTYLTLRSGLSNPKTRYLRGFSTRPERFELPTFGSVDRRSIQLS
jgi:hypothetical protein